MGQVPAAPSQGRSYDKDRRATAADIARLDREKAAPQPGSVQSTDGSTVRIPGPLDDEGRQGAVLTWDEDLHQPTWQAGGGVIGNAEAFSDTYTQDDYGLVFHSWAFTTHDYWPGDGAPTLVSPSSGADEFDPTVAGWYQGFVNVTFNISGAGGVPAFVRLEVNPDASANVDSEATDVHPMLTDGSSRFVEAVVPTSHFYHPGAGEGNHYLGFRLSYPNTPGVVVQAANVSYLLTRVR